MASRILAPSDIVIKGDRLELFVSGNTPLIAGPSDVTIRGIVDNASGSLGVEVLKVDELFLQGALTVLTWYQVDVEVIRRQQVAELSANLANVIDSQSNLYWNVQVSEVRRTKTFLEDPLGALTPDVPFSTAASIVGLAIIVVAIFIIVK